MLLGWLLVVGCYLYSKYQKKEKNDFWGLFGKMKRGLTGDEGRAHAKALGQVQARLNAGELPTDQELIEAEGVPLPPVKPVALTSPRKPDASGWIDPALAVHDRETIARYQALYDVWKRAADRYEVVVHNAVTSKAAAERAAATRPVLLPYASELDWEYFTDVEPATLNRIDLKRYAERELAADSACWQSQRSQGGFRTITLGGASALAGFAVFRLAEMSRYATAGQAIESARAAPIKARVPRWLFAGVCGAAGVMLSGQWLQHSMLSEFCASPLPALPPPPALNSLPPALKPIVSSAGRAGPGQIPTAPLLINAKPKDPPKWYHFGAAPVPAYETFLRRQTRK